MESTAPPGTITATPSTLCRAAIEQGENAALAVAGNNELFRALGAHGVERPGDLGHGGIQLDVIVPLERPGHLQVGDEEAFHFQRLGQRNDVASGAAALAVHDDDADLLRRGRGAHRLRQKRCEHQQQARGKGQDIFHADLRWFAPRCRAAWPAILSRRGGPMKPAERIAVPPAPTLRNRLAAPARLRACR